MNDDSLSAVNAGPKGEMRRAHAGRLVGAAVLALLVISGLSVALINAMRDPSLADFKVCTYPVSRCMGYQSQYMRTEPSRIVTSGDGSGFVEKISWTGWGRPTARGLGVLEIDNCTPSCTAGAYTGYRATVTLTDIVAFGNGTRAYAKIVVRAPGAPYTPSPFTMGPGARS